MLDPFGGSGTTLIACEKSGRRARLMGAHNMHVMASGSKFEALSAEGSTLDGLNIHLGCIDELDDYFLAFSKAVAKGRGVPIAQVRNGMGQGRVLGADTDFKQDVLSVLKGQYGSAVKVGDKAIAIDANGSRRKSDVIVATQFRRYRKFQSISDTHYVEGICFFNAAGERIANYPKQHSANLTAKHQAASKWLKPMARVFKNMRTRLVQDGYIKAGIAPSYYIEGLLYNVPNEKFTTSYQDCVANTLNWYLQEASKTDLVCANEQYYLLRDGYHTCWRQASCDAFIEAAVELWNKY